IVSCRMVTLSLSVVAQVPTNRFRGGGSGTTQARGEPARIKNATTRSIRFRYPPGGTACTSITSAYLIYPEESGTATSGAAAYTGCPLSGRPHASDGWFRSSTARYNRPRKVDVVDRAGMLPEPPIPL